MIFIGGLKDFRADKEKRYHHKGGNSTYKLYLDNASTGLHVVEAVHRRSPSGGYDTEAVG